MVDYILLLLFIVFVFLMIIDFFTTEHVLKLGGYEKSELLKYVAGKPIWHAIVKIIEIIFVFFFIQFVNIFTVYSVVINTIFLIFLNLGLIYAQFNNFQVIRTTH